MKTYKIRNKADGGILEVTEDQLAAYGLEVPNQMAKGGMIKRADGSYSRRGLWDNIRANKGSGKKPTKAMLAQEKKIRAAEKKQEGGLSLGDKIQLGLDAGQFLPPPFGEAAYIASLPFTTYDVGKNIYEGDYKQAGLDALGYIPTFKAFKYGMKGDKILNTTSKLAKQLKKANIATGLVNSANDAHLIGKQAYGGYMDMGGYMNPYMGYGGMYDMGGMYPMGGYVPMDMMAQGGINNPGFRALPEYVQEKIKDNMAYGGCKECGGKMQGGGTAKPSYNFPALMEKPTAMDSAVYRSNFNRMLKQDPYAVSEYQKMQKYGIPPTLDNETYTKALMWQNAYEDALSKLKKKESGGKLPKEVLRARLESHMSPGQAQDYLSTYGMGGYLEEAGDGKWIQKATASIKRRGTEGVCTGSKFGGPGCPPGSKRYNLAKTFRKMAKSKKEEGGYAQGGEYEMTDAEIAKLRSMGYKIKEV